jgi:hypothetical protein
MHRVISFLSLLSSRRILGGPAGSMPGQQACSPGLSGRIKHAFILLI